MCKKGANKGDLLYRQISWDASLSPSTFDGRRPSLGRQGFREAVFTGLASAALPASANLHYHPIQLA